MDTSSSLIRRDIGHVEDDISDLSIAMQSFLLAWYSVVRSFLGFEHIQDIGAPKAKYATCLILIAINQSESTEIRGGS